MGIDWDSNLGDMDHEAIKCDVWLFWLKRERMDWDYQMVIWERMIEKVVGLEPGEVLVYMIGQDRNRDRQIGCEWKDRVEISDWKNGNMGV